jgi:hypothetical protein
MRFLRAERANRMIERISPFLSGNQAPTLWERFASEYSILVDPQVLQRSTLTAPPPNPPTGCNVFLVQLKHRYPFLDLPAEGRLKIVHLIV